MLRGGIRPEEGIRGVLGRGKIDGDGVPGKRPRSHRIARQRFRYRKPRQPQQMPRRPRAIILAINFDSHVLSRTGFSLLGLVLATTKPHSLKPVPQDPNLPLQLRVSGCTR
jgi:hypothetical protein